MDLFSWIRKHPWLSAGIAVLLVIVIPFGIDKIFSAPSIFTFFSVSYLPEDVLAFYGIVLGSITTIVALIETIQHTEKMHELNYERKLTPVLNSNVYNHSATSKMPLRVLYVNTHPVEHYWEDVTVMTAIDLRDLKDTFIHCQIDYLIQNVSDTSAIGIKIFLNEQLLYGPFSLVPGGEESIGICFLDKKECMLDKYPSICEFDISVSYKNSNSTREFKQVEKLGIEYHLRDINGGPIMIPDYQNRTGLSEHIT